MPNGLRPHYAQTPWCWVDALEDHVDVARRVLGKDADLVISAYRLYLAGSAMAFEHGWMSLYQILGAHPDGVLERHDGAAQRSDVAPAAYPFICST